MSNSLRDQLMKAGFSAKPEPEPRARRPERARPPQAKGRPPQSSTRPSQPRSPQPRTARSESSDIDLAKAYALRARTERETREREQREAEQRGRDKKERRQKLAALVNGKALNDAAAEIPRHFPHGNKIRRLYVTAEQLPQLNGGTLAIVQFSGRYLLVSRELALAAQAIDADALVLLCDSPAGDDDGVPADLMW